MFLRNIATALLLSLAFSVASFAQESSRVILVLDASGSMRGKLDGKSKMDIAKQVVGSIIKTWKAEDELGLIAYGHREKGSCTDIEVLRGPAVLDAKDYMKAVNGLNPKGKTPMTAAVKMAAEALSYTEKKATIILVSDGIETCDLDPCAVATELEQLGIGLTVHTVGFGLDDKGAVAQLKCLAEKTGGTFSTANNADELQKALAKTVAASAPPAATAPPLAEQFNVRGHVKQTASLELSKPYAEPVWVFHKPDGADGTEGAYVSTEYNVDMKTNLPPGEYVVTVQSGKATVKVPIKVDADKVTKFDAYLESGIVKLQAMVDDQTPITDTEVVWDVHTSDGKFVDTDYGAAKSFMLNAGQYTVDLRLGEAKTQTEFDVKAGETIEKAVLLGSGKVKLSAVYAEGGEALKNGMSFEILKPAANTGEAEVSMATKYDDVAIFVLPSGKYLARVKLGIAETKKEIEVKAGQMTELVINTNIGFIAGKADGATSYEVLEGKKLLDGTNTSLSVSYDPVLNLAANAGVYLVKAFKSNELIGEKLVEVNAGERSEFTIP